MLFDARPNFDTVRVKTKLSKLGMKCDPGMASVSLVSSNHVLLLSTKQDVSGYNRT